MKKIITLMITACLVFSACDKKEKTSDTDKPVVKIGFIGPLSGDNAVMGQNCQRGLETALTKLENGKIKYEVIYEDDQFKAARSATAVSKLINVDKVNVVYACSAVTGNAIVAQTRQNKKFQMTICSSSEETAAASPFSFVHWTPPYKEGEKALELFKKNNVKKLVMISEVHTGAKALSDAVQEKAEQGGIEVKTFWVQSSERNYTDIIQKAAAEKADMWFLTVLQPGIDIIGKRVQEQHITVPYSSAEVPSLMTDKSMFENVEFVDVYDGDVTLLEQYQEKYNSNNVYAFAFAYDAMMIIDKLYEDFYRQNARLANSEELSAALIDLKNYSGAVGAIKVSPTGFLESEAVLKKIINGRPVVVEEL